MTQATNPTSQTPDAHLIYVQSTMADEPFRREWSDANYATTMPGNIEAFANAYFGGLF